jgi:hypothetical protein
MAIELHGSDADVDLLNYVLNLLAEYTGDHISAPELLNVLQRYMLGDALVGTSSARADH